MDLGLVIRNFLGHALSSHLSQNFACQTEIKVQRTTDRADRRVLHFRVHGPEIRLKFFQVEGRMAFDVALYPL